MKKIHQIFISLVLLSIVLFLFAPNTYAQSGCCSHHSGVCGCGCCDGTSLSATCARYYPQCGKETNYFSDIKAKDNTPSSPVSNNTEEKTSDDNQNQSSSSWGWLIFLGIGGFIGYIVSINRKK